ncbi:MAG TPA: DNA gyrase subunit A [Candidatus Borkfalkia faecipullorum]|uniref:DNA gyrase subunit A n=1 Tax=Candidatus Borkfalkia faecipullorum TaxID=2838510 RepID=A0A9D2AH13_9FIRM|nr:DNA gyrase subunit A [Candidatus Borkfalkia faecipullorum]
MTNMIDVEVDEELKKSFIAYAMAVNVSRAIPDVRDGLKPVHRRILYSMHEMGLYNEKPYRKCARIVGDVLGKYHPHGDRAVYDALVRLAQDFTINFPLVDGHGNFGSVDGDPPAAMRYTEARMSKLAAEMLRDLDKETVDFYPTFDDTGMQPCVLPSRFPNLLVNGSDGIAVGMATNIPPHNLAEVISGVIAQIDNPEITVDELMTYIPAPDFPTGAILMGRNGIKRAYRTGRGNYVLRAKCEIEDFTSGNTTRTRIIVSEIPYQVNKARLVENIADLVKDKRVEGISDIREESDRDGMRIVIELRKDANAQVVLNTLYKHTQLQTSNGIILLALVDGEPKVLNLKECIHYYIEHQKDVIVRRTRFDLNKAEERAHIVAGLVLALANIDEVIAIIKQSADKNVAAQRLMEAFELSDKQANAILEMRLQRLTSLEVEKLQEELAELERTIADLKDILANEQRVLDIIKTDLTVIKENYPSERKTELSYDYGEIDVEDLIEEEDIVISMTHGGYIKRQPVAEYKAQRRGGMGITAHKPKDEDFVEKLFISSTHDNILFFSSYGKVYSIKGYEIPEAQRQARGRAIVNLLQIEQDEKITAIIPLSADTTGYIAMATRNGLIKKTALEEFANIRKVGKIAIKVNEGDELISVQFTTGKDELIIASKEGKCIRFSEEDVRPMGRDTQGVRAMNLNEGDYLVDMLVVKPDCQILTITSNGYGKRSSVEDYRLQGRAGKGIKAGVFNEKTGYLVNLKIVNEDEDVMVISANGTIIRMHVSDISMIGRNTQGVRIMKLKDSTIATVAVAPREEEEPEETEAETSEDPTAENAGEQTEESSETEPQSDDGQE